ncbi:MAG: acetoacetyl-CoA reductase [Bacteroidota bacterium]|jgi:acetoacetyl-CoA reductase|nr:acetoacetyl-CoA reductase [Bacteroidota bacterium]
MKNKRERIALVTGGTGGIGTAICRALHADGYQVIANYKAFDKSEKWRKAAEKWQKQQLKSGIEISIAEGDVANYISIQKMIRGINKQYGSVDVLINNAGITDDAALYKMSFEQWSNVINTNLNGVFICTKLVIEGMLEKCWGRVINISSVNAQKGQAGQTNYSASKAGIYGFTKSLAAEVASRGITVNTVSPGHIESPMSEAVRADLKNKIIGQTLAGRLGKPEEVAAAVAYLVSEKAQFITGADIAVNGGLYMS